MSDRASFFLLGLLMSFCLLAQDGYYFHSQFSPMEDSRDQFHYDIEQDQNGKLYFANRYGLLSFDGSSWDIIETGGPIFSLIEIDSIIYAAGTRGLGIIKPDIYGNPTYKIISDSVEKMLNISMLEKGDSLLYMSNGDDLITYSPKNNQFTTKTINGEVQAILHFDNRLFVQTDNTIEIIGESIDVNKTFLENGPWIFCKGKPSIARWILSNDESELYIFDGFDLKPLKIEDNDYLKESKILNGEWLKDDLFAVGTLRGGAVFINPKSKKIDQIVNYHTGLPDNETQTLYVDKKNALWVSHPYGYTRVAPDIPFRSYNYYPGLEGALYSSTLFESTVYVGTNLGLFYLDQLKSFDEIVYYVKKNTNTKLTEESNENGFLSFLNLSKEKEPETKYKKQEEDEKKGGFLSFLKKKEEPKKPTLKKQSEPQKRTTTRKASKPKYVKKVRKELQSITNVYKKIEGIDGRISQLITVNNKELIASGLEGIFLVEHKKARKIFDEAVKYIYYSKKYDQLFASTYNGDLVGIFREGNSWKSNLLLEDMDEYVQYMLESEDKIWLCTSRKIFWISLDRHEIIDGGELGLTNEYLDPVVAVNDDSLGTIFIHGHGFFQLKADSLLPITYKGMENPTRYLASKQRILVSDGRIWHVLGHNSHDKKSFSFLNVFDNIISLDYESDGNLWVITGDNRFYRIDGESEFSADYNPFLKQIKSVNNQQLPITNRLKIEQDNSSLSFYFHQPEYSGMMEIDYRYMLEGLNESWSEWSPNNNVIEFPYLPSDNYKLRVETRNIFGSIKVLEPIHFEVVPPYWKRPWFFAAEFIFFATLLIISARLSKVKHYHLQILNRILAFLTIIMIIEFIQTVVETRFETGSSPVIDFFLQVFVAFCLLPLEGFMRSRFFRETDNKKENEQPVSKKNLKEASS